MRSRCSTAWPTTSFACSRRARPRSASTPARERRFDPSSPIAPRTGQQRIAKQLRADLERVNAFDTSGLSHATRTSVEVVRSAYATALEGFALPYGDITVGGWRNTPYVVIQNVGAYLDVPRFLDSDHRDRERRRRRGVPRAAAVVREAARRRARPHAGGARRRARAAGVPDRQGAGADAPLGEERARRRGARRVDRSGGRRTFPGNWAERARTIAAQEIAPALERQIARAAGAARGRDQRRRDLGAAARRGVLPVGAQGVDDHDHVAGRGPRDGPERAAAACTRRWTRS